MIIVFDLDHTLYDEGAFVLGGMLAVSNFLAPFLKVEAAKLFRELQAELQVGRNGVFDRVLDKYRVKSQYLIKKCLSTYRLHNPDITLYPEAKACLKRLTPVHQLYVVTDGNKIVQKRKFLALGLETMVKRCLCTYAFGVRHTKPSPYCFEKICEWEGVDPSQVVYVGDNPTKDFIGIKPLGFKTIRLLNGPYASMKVDPSFDGEVVIRSLNELNEALLKRL